MDPTRLREAPYGPRFGDGVRQEPSMARRAFLALVSVGLPTAPLTAEAQQTRKVPRIGFLSPSSLSDPRPALFVEAFQQGLRELGWIEGQNIAIEYRWAEERTEHLPDLASNLASLKVDVIVAATSPAIQAAKQATGTIPIVMAVVAETVARGFVSSIARPGGNITGLSMMAEELVGKQMEILRRSFPRSPAWLSSGTRPP
jgi:ABC-type uncharacterized transport system substrate-binding protein